VRDEGRAVGREVRVHALAIAVIAGTARRARASVPAISRRLGAGTKVLLELLDDKSQEGCPMIIPLLLAAGSVGPAPAVDDPSSRVVCVPTRDAFGRKDGKQSCRTVAEWTRFVRIAARAGIPNAFDPRSTPVPSGYYTSSPLGR
jgi:hypothetical protein